MRTVVLVLMLLIVTVVLHAGEDQVVTDSEETESTQDIIRKLGDIHYAVREAAQAQLVKRGKEIIPELEKAFKEHKDSEILLRVGELLYRFQRFGISGKLGDAEKSIVELPIETKLLKKGSSAEYRSYHMGEYEVLDIGKVRMACLSLQNHGSRSSSVLLVKGIKAAPKRSNQSSYSSNRRYSFQNEKGRVNCRVATMKFHIADGKIIVQGRTISLAEPTVVLAAKDGTLMRVISVKKEKK